MQCPKCGHEFKGKASLGEGTRRGADAKISKNRENILEIFRIMNKPLSVRDVQMELVKRKMTRISQRGAGWNYHTVQADMSILLGGKKLRMLKPHEKQMWSEEEGFTTKGIPLYVRR
jgi:hypothetical protein